MRQRAGLYVDGTPVCSLTSTMNGCSSVEEPGSSINSIAVPFDDPILSNYIDNCNLIDYNKKNRMNKKRAKHHRHSRYGSISMKSIGKESHGGDGALRSKSGTVRGSTSSHPNLNVPVLTKTDSVIGKLFPFLNQERFKAKHSSTNSTTTSSSTSIDTSCNTRSLSYWTVPTESTSEISFQSESSPMTTKQKKSILKTVSLTDAVSCTHPQKMPCNTTSSINSSGSQKKRNVTFSSHIQESVVSTLPVLSGIPKSHFWWQGNDYMVFRKSFKIMSASSFQKRKDNWHNKDTTSDDYYKGFNQSAFKDHKSNEKWRHKFDHSRRGIVEVVSIREFRQRQTLAVISIYSVLDEQKRQNVTNKRDIHKLAEVSMKHTRWAKDLALATGAANADALEQESNFDSAPTAKSREEHLSIILGARNSNEEDDDICSEQFILDAYFMDDNDETTSSTFPSLDMEAANTPPPGGGGGGGVRMSDIDRSSKHTAKALKRRDRLFNQRSKIHKL